MPPLPTRELTRSYALRYTNTQHVAKGNFSRGMLRDPASWELPEGACYRAVDMLCDKPGVIRKRGGYTSLSGSNLAAVAEWVTAYRSGGIDGLTTLIGTLGKGGVSIQQFTRGTGANTQVRSDGSVDTVTCKPFQHGNYMVCSFQATGATTNDRNTTLFVGASTQAGFTGLTGTVVAGDNRITNLPASLVAGHVGSIICVELAGAEAYVGRIVTVTSTTSVRVEPTPQFGIIADHVQVSPYWSSGLHWTNGQSISGRFGLSYQGRIVLGYTGLSASQSSADNVKGFDLHPYRLWWTNLQSDPIPHIFGSDVLDGEAVLFPNSFATYNYLDIPALGSMTGLAAAGEGTLIVFGKNGIWRVSGTLPTTTVLSAALTYTVNQVSANVFLKDQRSIQYTPRGLIFCGTDNIYLFDGAHMTALLSGTNAKYLQERFGAGDTIYGSLFAQTRNHYILSMSGTDGAIVLNLSNPSEVLVTLASNLTMFDSTTDPLDASIPYAIKWWDTTAAAPTIVKGQLWRMDSLWSPSGSNKTDGDGTSVLFDWQGASWADGGVPAKKRYPQIRVGYDHRCVSGPVAATLFADTKLNTADASYVTIGSLGVSTVPQVTGFWVMPLLAKGQALEVRITAQGSCDSFELEQVVMAMQLPRAGRSN